MRSRLPCAQQSTGSRCNLSCGDARGHRDVPNPLDEDGPSAAQCPVVAVDVDGDPSAVKHAQWARRAGAEHDASFVVGGDADRDDDRLVAVDKADAGDAGQSEALS